MSAEKVLLEEISKSKDASKLLEKRIEVTMREIYHTVTHPAGIIKRCIKDLASDKDFKADLGRIAVNVVAKGVAGGSGWVSTIVTGVAAFLSRKQKDR